MNSVVLASPIDGSSREACSVRHGGAEISERLILSLCDFSGEWSQPYVDAGYRVVRMDLGYDPGVTEVTDRLHHIGCDVTNWDFPWRPWGVLAAPSCTTFCRPGARWWKRQDARGETERGHAAISALPVSVPESNGVVGA